MAEAAKKNVDGQLEVVIAGGSASAPALVTGDVAHDAAEAGAANQNPVAIGGSASAAPPAAVSADGDRVKASATRFGQLRVAVSGVIDAGTAADVEVEQPANIAATDVALATHDASLRKASRRVYGAESNQSVTNAVVVTFGSLTAGEWYRIGNFENVHFDVEADPSATAGSVKTAGAEDIELPAGADDIRVIAITTTGRVSVTLVSV